MFTTRLEPELLKEAKKLAIDLERPLNVIIEDALRDFLEKHDRVVHSKPDTPKRKT